MPNHIAHDAAQDALNTIGQRQRQVIAEIDMPPWYWWGLALGWVTLAVVTDVANPWVALAATLAFGAAHSAVASRVLSGRHRTQQLSVRAGVAGRHIPALVIGFLVAMSAATTFVALAVNADGADHPVTIAGVIVALAVLCGGPTLMAAVRRHAERALDA